jgi:hypothetical protein
VLTLTAVLLLGRRVLGALRRTSRIAAFDVTPTFTPPVATGAQAIGQEPTR